MIEIQKGVYCTPKKHLNKCFDSSITNGKNTVNLRYGDVIFSFVYYLQLQRLLENSRAIFFVCVISSNCASVALFIDHFCRIVRDSVLMSLFSLVSLACTVNHLGTWKYSGGRRLTQELLISYIRYRQQSTASTHVYGVYTITRAKTVQVKVAINSSSFSLILDTPMCSFQCTALYSQTQSIKNATINCLKFYGGEWEHSSWANIPGRELLIRETHTHNASMWKPGKL